MQVCSYTPPWSEKRQKKKSEGEKGRKKKEPGFKMDEEECLVMHSIFTAHSYTPASSLNAEHTNTRWVTSTSRASNLSVHIQGHPNSSTSNHSLLSS